MKKEVRSPKRLENGHREWRGTSYRSMPTQDNNTIALLCSVSCPFLSSTILSHSGSYSWPTDSA